MRPVSKIINAWPTYARERAEELIDRYGPPAEVSESRLLWWATADGWKRTVVSSFEVPHDFPAPHFDCVQQTIDYRVPADMFSSLARFDGSLVAHRTSGELSAHCPDPAINFSLVNLAHDIVTGKTNPGDARAEHTRLCEVYNRGERPPYSQSFQFALSPGGTQDSDVTTVAPIPT